MKSLEHGFEIFVISDHEPQACPVADGQCRKSNQHQQNMSGVMSVSDFEQCFMLQQWYWAARTRYVCLGVWICVHVYEFVARCASFHARVTQ